MARWTQYSEDPARLPEGFQRTGYDADTLRYAFKDEKGRGFVGAPGEEYGSMVQEGHVKYPSKGDGNKLHSPQYDRPVFFADKPAVNSIDSTSNPFATPEDSPPSSPRSTTARRRNPYDHTIVPNTFADILPPHLIAAAPPIVPTKASSNHHSHPHHSSPTHSPPSSPKKKGSGPNFSLKAGARAIGRSLSMAKRHEKRRSDVEYEAVREE